MILDFLRIDPPDGPRMQRTIRALSEAAQGALVQELDYFDLEVAFGLRPWTDGATFRSGPEMGSARSQCAVVSAGGRIFVFGSHMGKSALDSTEVLEMQTMAFSAGPDMLTARGGCAAVQLDAGRVRVVGGVDASDEDFYTTEIFHLATRTFTPGPDMQSARSYRSAVALDARRILVVGGHDAFFDGGSCLSTTEIFNLDTMAFTPGPVMATAREGCAAVALDEHRIMVAGGSSDSSDTLITTEVLDVRTMSFAPGPSMGSARCFCSALQVDAQHVLIIGGIDSTDTSLATTELLDVATMAFEPGPTMQDARSSTASARLDAAEEETRILVLGGGLSTTEVHAVDARRGARATRQRQ